MLISCAQKTYAATTISDIVSGASISRTTFYKQFADKRACFDASLEYCIDEISAVAAAAATDADSPAEATRRASAAGLAALAARPELAHLLAAEAIAVEPAAPARYRELLVPVLERLWQTQPPRDPRTNPGLAFGRAQLLIFSKIAAGRADRLTELHPEIVYLALAPFAGHEEAVRQSRIATEEIRSEVFAET